ncbi:MAG: ThuA domain-containing protein [Eubacteriales bacterium]|nr:ThuA domain-containing protein [Eubacteriales bacterium]
MRKALIVQGGWQGHEPVQVSEVFARVLRAEGFDVTISDTLDSLLDLEALKQLHLLVPAWTMGTISKEQSANASLAVASGVGLAGCHGGMCDSFRQDTNWQFMTGGQWVAHPGNDGTPYQVNIRSSSNPITEGIADFEVKSEQYYVHVDPAVEVLASTLFPNPAAVGFHSSNPLCAVPVVWTKRWGHGRVFYNSLGHHADIFDASEPIELMRRGFLWAADGKDRAVQLGLKLDDFLPKT